MLKVGVDKTRKLVPNRRNLLVLLLETEAVVVDAEITTTFASFNESGGMQLIAAVWNDRSADLLARNKVELRFVTV